jgi:hypothetical protein
MAGAFFIFDYLVWHYTRAFRDVSSFWMNIAWFVIHFFSIPLLLRTLFSPWKRVTTEHTKYGLEDLAETILFNIMSRVVGALIRSVLLIMGIVSLVVVLVAYVAFLTLWAVLPAVALFSLMSGISLLLT